MHRSFQPTSCLDAIWTCEDSAASQLSQWISMRVGHRRGTNTAYKNDRHEAFFHWPQYRWFHLMKVSRNKKMAVLKLQYSDKGGVMTKIMGNHTGDHNIQLFKLNRNVISIWEFLPPVAIVQIVLAWNFKGSHCNIITSLPEHSKMYPCKIRILRHTWDVPYSTFHSILFKTLYFRIYSWIKVAFLVRLYTL